MSGIFLLVTLVAAAAVAAYCLGFAVGVKCCHVAHLDGSLYKYERNVPKSFAGDLSATVLSVCQGAKTEPLPTVENDGVARPV